MLIKRKITQVNILRNKREVKTGSVKSYEKLLFFCIFKFN